MSKPSSWPHGYFTLTFSMRLRRRLTFTSPRQKKRAESRVSWKHWRQLAAAPIRSGGMTAAALVRTIDAKKPTDFS